MCDCRVYLLIVEYIETDLEHCKNISSSKLSSLILSHITLLGFKAIQKMKQLAIALRISTAAINTALLTFIRIYLFKYLLV